MPYAVFAVFTLILFMAGASAFSFFGVLCWRLPRGIPFVRGRSFCPECGRTLEARCLIPVFSYILLRGKCRYCGAKIPVSELLGECAGGTLLCLCCVYSGVYRAENMAAALLRAAIIFIFIGLLYVISRIDAETQEIPDGLVAALAILALISVPCFNGPTLLQRLIGAAAASVPLLLITLMISGAFGGGDIKLMAAAGFFLGWKSALFALFAAIITGGAYGIWLLASKRAGRKDHFAFGPYLGFGCALAVFVGDLAVDYYISLLRL